MGGSKTSPKKLIFSHLLCPCFRESAFGIFFMSARPKKIILAAS
jgi:hypothetical protein